jgi:hypothetical protein
LHARQPTARNRARLRIEFYFSASHEYLFVPPTARRRVIEAPRRLVYEIRRTESPLQTCNSHSYRPYFAPDSTSSMTRMRQMGAAQSGQFWFAPQQCLYFLPLPQVHGSLRRAFSNFARSSSTTAQPITFARTARSRPVPGGSLQRIQSHQSCQPQRHGFFGSLRNDYRRQQ